MKTTYNPQNYLEENINTTAVSKIIQLWCFQKAFRACFRRVFKEPSESFLKSLLSESFLKAFEERANESFQRVFQGPAFVEKNKLVCCSP